MRRCGHGRTTTATCQPDEPLVALRAVFSSLSLPRIPLSGTCERSHQPWHVNHDTARRSRGALLDKQSSPDTTVLDVTRPRGNDGDLLTGPRWRQSVKISIVAGGSLRLPVLVRGLVDGAQDLGLSEISVFEPDARLATAMQRVCAAGPAGATGAFILGKQTAC